MILIKNLPEVYFINNPPPPLTIVATVTKTGAHKFSGLQCVNYHVIRTKIYQNVYFINHRPPTESPNLPKDWGALVTRSMRCELPSNSHKSYWGYISSPSRKVPGPGGISYRVSDVWVTMLFIRKLSRDTWSPPPLPDKFIKTRVHKLSGLWCVSYRGVCM